MTTLEDADASRLRADSVEVNAGHEAIALVLGTGAAHRRGEQNVEIRRVERLVLSPAAARSLYVRLRDTLRHLESAPEETALETQARTHDASDDEGNAVPCGDGTTLKSTYTNTTEVKVGHNAIDVLFGVEQARQAGQDEIRIEPVRLVTLSRSVAAQLAVDLNQALTADAPAPDEREEFARGWALGEGPPPDASRHEDGSGERVEQVLTLFRQMGRLDATIDFEPSIKAVAGRLFENRFLLGFDRRETAGDRDDRIVSICRNIDMPGNLLTPFEEDLADANHVYFAVEKNDRALLFKVYLEFRDRVVEQMAAGAGTGSCFRLFTGFKWDSFLPTRQAVSRYSWYPSLPVSDMLARIRSALDTDGRHAGLSEFADALASRASGRIPPEDIQYLEVTEEGNPRRSFDLNIYKSGLTLEDVRPDLLRALQCVDVPSSRFEPLYQRIKTARFGHLAAGIDRENNDFLSVYYGVRDVHSSQLAAAKIAREQAPPRPRW